MLAKGLIFSTLYVLFLNLPHNIGTKSTQYKNVIVRCVKYNTNIGYILLITKRNKNLWKYSDKTKSGISDSQTYNTIPIPKLLIYTK